MFGYHKTKRKKNRLKKEQSDFEAEKNLLEGKTSDLEQAQKQKMDQDIANQTQAFKDTRTKGREEGRLYAEDVLNRDVQGLSPQKKSAMQYEAQRGIQREMQNANRKLLGSQSQRGISGKSGVAYAQQRDLEKLGSEARGDAERDLTKLDEDLKLKKLAAMFNVEQGEASQAQLDQQMAIDQLSLEEEKKRQRLNEDKFNRLFERI